MTAWRREASRSVSGISPVFRPMATLPRVKRKDLPRIRSRDTLHGGSKTRRESEVLIDHIRRRGGSVWVSLQLDQFLVEEPRDLGRAAVGHLDLSLGRGVVQPDKEDQTSGTNRDLGARSQGGLADQSAINQGSVCTPEVLDVPALVARHDLGVGRAHERIVEQHVSALTSDDQRVSRVEGDVETLSGARDDLEEGARHQALQDSAFSRLAR